MLDATNPEQVTKTINNPDAWFGVAVKIEDWQELRRIPGDAPSTLEEQLTLALLDVNLALADWKADQEVAGVSGFPAEKTGYYSAAVYDMATARLLPILPTLIKGETARGALDGLNQTPEDWERSAMNNIARIKGGKPGRCRAALI
ncbi:MAG: head completion/stabilization protein [Deltaproteobacteria bacterium]|nr:head completion/stabilization protein [Deltaproteobacteria bacterium]